MSLSTSRRPIKHDFVDFIFVFSLLVIALLVLAPLNNIYNSARTSIERAPANLRLSGNPSFESDRQYWDANCSHGGTSSDATCNAISVRTQSCSISADSAYCSQYNHYMQQLHNSQNELR